MEVAALGLKVEGAEGIDRAASALDRLSESSDGAEKSSSRLRKVLAWASRESSSAATQMSKAGREASTAAGGVDKLKRSMDGAQSSASSLKGILTGAFVGVSIAGTIGKIISETRNAEQEQAQLAAVLKSTGNAAGFTRDELNEMAEAMSATSTLSAGEITQAQTSLLAFSGVAGNQFKDALQSAIDMSARTGMSVTSAMETIGRALDVPSQGLTALSRQGFKFTDDQKELAERLEATGKKAEAQGIVLSALKESYGGAAAAARDTFGGAISGLQNTISDLLTGSDGSLDEAKEGINDLSDTLRSPEVKQAFADLVSLVTGATTALVNFAAASRNGWPGMLANLESAAFSSADAAAEIATLRQEIERMEAAASNSGSFNSWVFEKGIDYRKGRIATLEAQIEADQKDYVSNPNRFVGAMPLPTTLAPVVVTPTGGSTKPKSKKSEVDEGKRYIQQLNERIALIGKETEYEQLLAKVSVGSLTFRTELMEKDALAAAGRYDILKKTFDAEKEAEKAAQAKLERRKNKFGDDGDDADKYILGKTDPLSGGMFDNQFARYEAEAEAEKERYQGQLDRLREARELQIETSRSYDEIELAAKQQYADRMAQIDRAKTSLALGSASDMFGSLADIMRTAGKEQSGIYKAMFFAQKAAAIAQAIVNTEEGATKALAMGPFGIPMSTFIRATGYASVAAMAAQTIQGMAHDGIDSVPQTGTWLLEKGERVTTAKTSARLDSVLERIDARQRGAYASSESRSQAKSAEPRVVVQLMGSEFQGAQITEERGATEEEVIVRVMSKEFLRGGQSFQALASVTNVRRVGS